MKQRDVKTSTDYMLLCSSMILVKLISSTKYNVICCDKYTVIGK